MCGRACTNQSKCECVRMKVNDVLEQQQDQQSQQQVRQEALASLRAAIEEELQPLREQLHDEAVAALQSNVAQLVQVEQKKCMHVLRCSSHACALRACIIQSSDHQHGHRLNSSGGSLTCIA